MTIHLYSRSYNDTYMVNYFLRHYETLADRIVVFDDGSTDDTVALLRKHPRVEVRPTPPYDDPESRVVSAQTLLNTCWKESRSTADWVIIVDMDEHLCHDDLPAYLDLCRENMVTFIPALGFQMISEQWPEADSLLCSQIQAGVPDHDYSKPSIFNPREIQETGFALGRHTAQPQGYVLLPPRAEVLLLHFKHVGFDRVIKRHKEYLARQRSKDLSNLWGFQYSFDESELRSHWDKLAGAARPITRKDEDFARFQAGPHWWSSLPHVKALY